MTTLIGSILVAAGAVLTPNLPKDRPVTEALQKAIDDAAAQGGGKVVVSRANKPYTCYTLYLKSNVELHLEEGAVLKGGPDGKKYPEFAPTDLWAWNRTPRFDKRAFVYACGVTNVAITGKGVIDGSSEAFRTWSPKHKRYWRTHDRDITGRCLFFVRCADVRLEDFTVLHTTGWNTWILGCDRVTARGVTLDTDPEYPNGDGFHISSSRDVLVEKCRVFSSDDSFAIRSHQELLPPELAACERITVRDTVCSSSGASFCRFGWSTDYAVRDVLFDNVVCSNCWEGVSVRLPNLDPNYLEPPRGHGLKPLPPEQCKPFELERIVFRNCRITSEVHPFEICVGNALKTRPVGFIRNLRFENVVFDCTKPPQMVVWAENNVSDILFRNVDFNIRKTPREKIIGTDHVFFDNCRDVRFEDCRWNMGGASVAFAPQLPADFSLPVANTALRTDSWIGSGMVFQRGRAFVVRGEGKPGATVQAALDGHVAKGTVGKDGRWSVTLPPFKAGGPYVLAVESSTGEKLTMDEVYAGDVWMCSGQSNMEMPVWGSGYHYRLPDGQEVAAAAHDPMLRLMQVPHALDIRPVDRLPEGAKWRGATTPEAVKPFSSVGYFFGLELRKRHPDVPVGLINASWGGTRIEPWIPEGAFGAAGYGTELNRLAQARRDDLEYKSPARDGEPFLAWVRAFLKSFEKGIKPGPWTKGNRGTMPSLLQPGVAEYRFTFDVKPGEEKHNFVFHMDFVDDADITYLDGKQIGATMPTLGHKYTWERPRNYAFTVQAPGRHEIVVRGFSHRGALGIGTSIRLEDRTSGAKTEYGEAEWEERILFLADAKALGEAPMPGEVALESKCDNTLPTCLYNAMIAPFDGMPLTGALWFQGCANGNEADRYAGLGRTLVASWRDVFRTPKMPFLVAQIGAFKKETPKKRLPDDFWKTMEPDDTGFAYLREAQYEYGTEENCGVVCAMDIGDHSNIHFPNKKEVGRRLAREAFRIAYGEEGFAPGPSVARAFRRGSSAIVETKDFGEGLVVDGDGTISPRVFVLVGTNGVPVWATAKLIGKGTFEVSAPEVDVPAEVRYCFTGYAGGNLVRRTGDGLPIFPFRTTVLDENDFRYGPSPKHVVSVTRTCPGATGAPVLVWFHGGGLQAGDRTAVPQTFLKATTPLVVVSADYRFLRETKVENIWDDAARAVRWAADNAEKFGGDPKKIFLSGHSAGAYLSFMLGFNPAILAKYGMKNTDLCGIMPISGQVTEHFGVRWAAKDPDDVYQPKINPRSALYYIGGELPPVQITCGDRTCDMPCRTVENELLVASLRQLGKRDIEFYEIAGADHGGCVEPGAGNAMNFIAMHAAGCPRVTATVDFSKSAGKVRPVHSVGQPPILGWSGDSLFHYLTEANIPYARLHDTGGAYAGNRFVDVPNIFRDFDADENDPKSYDFAFTDRLLASMAKAKLKPIYRLGVTIENEWYVGAQRIAPPKDFAKWARICEHIIAHYNEGWANGFKYGIEYWEIWNEPEPSVPWEEPDPRAKLFKKGELISMMWSGTKEQFFELYETTSRHLRKRFGNTIKIGGPASTGCFGMTYAADDMSREARAYRLINGWNRDFLKFVAEKKCPMDFYSFHSYRPIDKTIDGWKEVSEILAQNGLKVEKHLNEWNNVNMSAEYGRVSQAAHYAGMLIALQNETDLDLACFYDAGIAVIGPKVNYKGLFTPYCRPNVGYWPFQCFGELYALGTAVPVKLEQDFEGLKGVRALAAKDGKGDFALLIANTGNSVKLTLKGLPEKMRAYAIDDSRGMHPIGFKPDNLLLPAHGVVYLKKAK